MESFHSSVKGLFILIFLLFLCISYTLAQTQTLILQPGPADGKDASMRTDYPNTNSGTDDNFIANAWTVQGNFFIMHSLIQFDLTSIPVNSTVLSAILFLSTNLNSGHHQLDSGANASYLLRVLASWIESQVTWNTQPPFSMSDPVILPQSTSDTEHYYVDVTSHVQDMVSNPSLNFGWLFKLQTEALYRCMVFASSDNAVTTWRPKLTVIYCTIPDSAGTIYGPDSVCQGDVGKVYTVPPITNVINYIWNLPSGASITSGANTDSITVNYSMSAVSGNITVYGSDSCGPGTQSQPFHVTVNPAPIAYANAGEDESICKGKAYTLSNASARGYTMLIWTTSGNGSFNDIHGLHPVYLSGENDILTGQVFLILTASGQSPCNSISDSMTLSITNTPVATAGPDGSICRDIPFQVIGANAQNFSSILWIHNGTGTLSGVNTFSPTYYPAPGDINQVILTLTAYGNAVCSDTFATDQLVISIYHPPIVDAGPDQFIPFNTGTLLSGTITGGSGSYIYDWEPVSLLKNNTAENPETVNLTKDTVFMLTIIDSISGCISSDSIRVKVGPHENSENCLIFHNVITPNGDGLNDAWIIDCIEEFPDNKVEIFNRWGNKVNFFQNYNNTTMVWKGTNLEGHVLPDGTYFYTLSIKNGGKHNGWVLIRSGSK